MNKIYTILFIVTIVLSAYSSAKAQNVNIPDPNFKSYLIGSIINTNGDSEIQVSEAEAFSGALNVRYQEISDMTGIEAFTSLVELDCSDNSLSSLDVSSNIALTSLYCNRNQLSNLNVSANTTLQSLNCSSNQLTNLDVSSNTELTDLSCFSNQLSDLNVSNNTKLSSLVCSANPLGSLDVSLNTALLYLYCTQNQLSNLDVRANTALIHLYCSTNQLSSLDISLNTALTNLICGSNQLKNLNVNANTALMQLSCHTNQLSSLDVSANTALQGLHCYSNELASLDVSTNTALQGLYCSSNKLRSLDVSANTSLVVLFCDSNQLSSLNVKNGNNLSVTGFNALDNPNLSCISVNDVDSATVNWTNIDPGVSFSTDCEVYVPDTNFKTYLVGNSAININGDDEIQFSEADLFNGMIDVGSLGISDLTGIEAFTLITGLNCSSNLLNRLDVRHNANLTHLSCSDNTLKVLNICNGNNSNISTFEAFNNPNLNCISVSDVNYATANWTNIDPGVSFNTDCVVYIPDANFKAYLVSNADINTNGDGEIQFSEAEVFHGSIRAEELGITDMTGIEAFTAITFLDCGRNALNDLDVSQNVALETLRCDGNTLTSLDVSANEALVDLYCRSNSISSLDVSNNLNLTDLNFGINLVSSIDVSANIALMKLTCNENSISSLDVSNNTALLYLFCDHNSISNLDVSNNTALTRLHCGQNPLGSLDVSNNIELISLSCSDNSLSSLDVSMNTALTSLSCSGNSLNSLNISANLNLHLLYCFNNAITELDLKNNTALGLLLCHDNALSNLDLRNGNNSEIFAFNATNNQDLSCISVSEVDYTTNNWTNIDPGVVFSSDCRYQEISFDALANKAYGDADFSLSATASSGLAVSYSSSNTLVATISGSAVTIVGAGSTTITAAQMGDSNYDAAIAVDQLFTVNKSSQTITFGPLADKIYGDADFTLNASTSSGLAVSYSSSNTSVATISGSTVTIVGAGSTTIAAAQIGDNNYDAAAVVEQMLVIKKANQIITFEELTDRNFEDGDLVLSATSSSGLPVSFTSSNTSVAIIAASNVDIIDAGITIITAFQSGDINYNKADDVSQELSIIITGIEDQISIIGFKLSPNPVKDYLYLECDNNKQIRSITIIDNAGKRVFRQYEYVNGSPINISGFKRGLYHLIAETDYLEIKEKFIIE